MTNFQNKKKDFSGQKNKLGLSLRRKKRIFGSKIGKIFENNVQKLSNFKETSLSFSIKKEFFGPKIMKTFENKVQKLTNLKEEKGLFGPTKTSFGWAYEEKKDFLGKKLGKKLSIKAKNWPSLKKKRKKVLFGPKNKLGLSLSRTKGFFGPKIGKQFENKVTKLTNFKEKKGFLWPKKPAGAELKNKKRSFLGKNSDRNWI